MHWEPPRSLLIMFGNDLACLKSSYQTKDPNLLQKYFKRFVNNSASIIGCRPPTTHKQMEKQKGLIKNLKPISASIVPPNQGNGQLIYQLPNLRITTKPTKHQKCHCFTLCSDQTQKG